MITIAVGDDHPVVRAGVVQMLGSSGDVDVVAEAGNGAGLLEAIRQHRPDVALTDFRMPDLDGASLSRAVRDAGMPTRVLVLSAYTDVAIVHRCLESGAAGFVAKDASSVTILQAIADVAAGRDVVPADVVANVVDLLRRPRAGSRPPELSERELDILGAVARGMSTPRIAATKHLSQSTVKTYLQRIYEKLDVNDRGAAVAAAMRWGILQ